MKITATLALLSVSTMVVCAKDNKDRERVYVAPFDKVWIACIQAASEKYVVLHSDKASGVFAFSVGPSFVRSSAGLNVGVTVLRLSDEQTRVVLNPQKIGSQISSVGDIPKKFFDAVDKGLK